MWFPIQSLPMTAGVPAPFTADLGELVCARLREGNTLIVIAKELGITRQTVYKWMSNNPLFANAYAVARAEGAHALIDESMHIADNPVIDPQRARNMITARQWAAERRNRKEYGASVDVNLTERVDIGGALIEARKRIVLPGSNLQQITDAQVIDVSPHSPMRAKDKETAAHVPVVNPFD